MIVRVKHVSLVEIRDIEIEISVAIYVSVAAASGVVRTGKSFAFAHLGEYTSAIVLVQLIF